MKVMILNCGSSSVKYALFEMPDGKKLSHGIVQRVAMDGSFINHFGLSSSPQVDYHECPDHATAVEWIFKWLIDKKHGAIRNIQEIKIVGHRVVHGGEKFSKPMIIDNEVINKIEECSILAPLHNPANFSGIKAAMAVMPDILHAAIFDTAFFNTLPPHVFIYGLPFEWYEKHNIRKYGFHGTSHRYVAKKAAVFLGRNINKVNLITLHIGNGVSISAIKGGVAYDHSMGFTPLEGAVMGTRCGDIDPAIPLYMMKKKKLGPNEMEDILNKKSGLLGISGKYSDRREILKAMEDGDERARLSFEVECYRLRKYIGAYTAGMGSIDGIVFTGGVGENSFVHRLRVCENLEFFGIELDKTKNEQAVGGEKEMEISSSSSRIKIFVIPTDEELIVAKDSFALLKNGREVNQSYLINEMVPVPALHDIHSR